LLLLDEKMLQPLFNALREAGYVWDPVCPERLQKLRQSPAGFRPSVRFFGLGVDVPGGELLDDGVPPELLPQLMSLRPAVSGSFATSFVVHQHWPSPKVYHSEESAELIRWLRLKKDRIDGAMVLDLGSGAGALTFEVAALGARRVLGIEAAEEAVHWARASALAQGIDGAEFVHAWIGTSKAESLMPMVPYWDVAVFNPPMAIPSTEEIRLHRDGGELGVAIPLRFLEFARRRLKTGGEVFCLATNPLVGGRGEFFRQLPSAHWQIVDRARVNHQFNRSLHRKEGYQRLGIERVELWLLHLRKRD